MKTALSTLLGLMLISTAAQADSGVRYPANLCVAYTGTPSYANGNIINNANVPLGLECAIPTWWKTPDATQIVGLKWVRARVVDNNRNGVNIKCELFTADSSETVPNVLETASFQTRFSTGASGLPQDLVFSNAPTNESSFSILRCVLPPKVGASGSALISYTSETDVILD